MKNRIGRGYELYRKDNGEHFILQFATHVYDSVFRQVKANPLVISDRVV